LYRLLRLFSVSASDYISHGGVIFPFQIKAAFLGFDLFFYFLRIFHCAKHNILLQYYQQITNSIKENSL